MEDHEFYLKACSEASSWTIADGRSDGRHVIGIRVHPDHAAQLAINADLTFEFDPETMHLSGAMTDGAPIDYSEDTELPFGEPGSLSDYECCKNDPLQYVKRLLRSAVAEARYAADAAAGRLRSIVFFRPNGDYALEMGEYPSDVSPNMAVTAIVTFYALGCWGEDMGPDFRLAGADEEAEVLAYSAPLGEYHGWTAERLEASGGVLLARLVEQES